MGTAAEAAVAAAGAGAVPTAGAGTGAWPVLALGDGVLGIAAEAAVAAAGAGVVPAAGAGAGSSPVPASLLAPARSAGLGGTRVTLETLSLFLSLFLLCFIDIRIICFVLLKPLEPDILWLAVAVYLLLVFLKLFLVKTFLGESAGCFFTAVRLDAVFLFEG